MQSLSHIKLIFATILFVELFLIIDGQFFTKTGSKSIPRMGRRADNSLWSSMIPSHSSYNRKVMEALLDRYNEKKSTESENSMTGLPSKAHDNFDANEHHLKAKNEKPRTASEPLEENDDQMNTSSEVRRLQSLLKTFINKS